MNSPPIYKKLTYNQAIEEEESKFISSMCWTCQKNLILEKALYLYKKGIEKVTSWKRSTYHYRGKFCSETCFNIGLIQDQNE